MEIKYDLIKKEYLVKLANNFLDKVLEQTPFSNSDKCPGNIKMHMNTIMDLESAVPKMIIETHKANVYIVLFMLIGTISGLYFTKDPLTILNNYWWLIAIILCIIHTLFTAIAKYNFGLQNFKSWKKEQLKLLCHIIGETPAKYIVKENNMLIMDFHDFLNSEDYKKNGLFSFKKESVDYILKMMTAYSRVTNYFKIRCKLPLDYKYTCTYTLDDKGNIIKFKCEDEAL